MAGGARGQSGAEVRWEPDIRAWMAELRQSPERADLEVRRRWREAAGTVRDRARARAWQNRPSSTQRGVRPRTMQSWRDYVNSIRSGATGTTPWVAVGSDRVRWALGQEFGSYRYPQFPPWKGRGTDAGYAMWPVFREEQPRIVRETLEALAAGFRAAFPKD